MFGSLIYHSTEHAAIVLEDLSINGFTTLHAPNDYETSCMIFHRLAMYHAASFYMTRKEVTIGKK
jgi:Ecdysteroid kinase-like family